MNHDTEPGEPSWLRSVVSTAALAAVILVVAGLLIWLMSAPTSA